MLPEQVHRVHSPQWRAAGAKEKIRNYFAALNLPGDLAVGPIVDCIHSRFPEQFKAFGEAVADRENGFDRADIYALKNSSLEFSLLAGAAFRGAVHRVVMRWIAERGYSPTTVLDVGCDNGILTCFYALLWPAATITGIDISVFGVERARELADKLHLTNVNFVASSIEDFAKENHARFSLVLTTTFIHEAGYFAPLELDRWFLDETFKPLEITAPPFFTAVAALLSAKDARWIGAEAIVTPHLLWRWVGALQSAGLRLESDACARIKHGEDFVSILTVGDGRGDLATPAWVTSYWTREKLPVIGPKTRLPSKFSGLVAQFVFDAVAGKRRVAVARKWDEHPPPSGRERDRVEIWLTDAIVLLFRVNADLVMELYLLEIRELSNARKSWQAIAQLFEDSGCRFERQIDV